MVKSFVLLVKNVVTGVRRGSESGVAGRPGAGFVIPITPRVGKLARVKAAAGRKGVDWATLFSLPQPAPARGTAGLLFGACASGGIGSPSNACQRVSGSGSIQRQARQKVLKCLVQVTWTNNATAGTSRFCQSAQHPAQAGGGVAAPG